MCLRMRIICNLKAMLTRFTHDRIQVTPVCATQIPCLALTKSGGTAGPIKRLRHVTLLQ